MKRCYNKTDVENYGTTIVKKTSLGGRWNTRLGK